MCDCSNKSSSYRCVIRTLPRYQSSYRGTYSKPLHNIRSSWCNQYSRPSMLDFVTNGSYSGRNRRCK